MEPTTKAREEENDGLRQFVMPEELRRRFTSQPYDGRSYRWFLSDNVVCLATYRRRLARRRDEA
jgi:hypothetical protein